MHRVGRRTLYLIPAIVAIGGTLAWYTYTPADALDDTAITAEVKRGDLGVVVTTTGELRARKFVQVSGPPSAQMAQVYQTKISSIVPEGQIVKEGEVIAELDKGPVAAKLSEVTLNLQKASAQYTSAQLDSALNLAQAREHIRIAEYLLE
jgi:multidrug efflux pump subunit AcrA (membrane-fusion protein)